MTKTKRLRIYVVDNGTIHFAVAATSRKTALEIFNGTKGIALGRVSDGYARDYGFIWERGQVEGTDVIFDNPGTVYYEAKQNSLRAAWVPAVEKGEEGGWIEASR